MLLAKSTRPPRVLLTTSYPSEPGILRTSVCKCDKKRIGRFLPSFPEDLWVSLFLLFLFLFSPGCLSTAILIQLGSSGSMGSDSLGIPSGRGPALPSQPRPFGQGGPSCHIQFTQEGEGVDRNLIFIENPVLHELSTLLFSMAMPCTVTLPLGVGN